ncbi:hypothetical protein GCM10010345_76980 [Streptomyces canarius]|uniref:AB hydrolase-1 domain-containing protein n=1 Tax=Streptomyces canarius TaxID=285453 RepID=A0ABQ3D8C2_9ACTN|nr:hypothetical protein GCM10010345_76980 [Streptomyces canarius]
MFEGFETRRVDVGEASVLVRYGGEGPPVVLLHGHPRTSATWHRVAPLLVRRGFTVVCPDLRGYGRSTGPAPTADHAGYSKRAVPGDVVEVMRSLGHARFALAGHDRGGSVALRLALDRPDAVSRVALIDCLPLTEHLSRITTEFATQWWHWFFFAQPDIPERVINADPDSWYRGAPGAWGRRTMTSGARPRGTPTWCGRCWRTTGPVSPSTGGTRRTTAPPGHGSGARR